MTTAIALKQIADLKHLGDKGGKVVVVSSFCTNDFRVAPLAIAFELTQALIDEIKANQLKADSHTEARSEFVITTGYDWLMPAPDKGKGLSDEEKAQWEDDIAMAMPNWVMYGSRDDFWLEEDSDGRSGKIQSRMMTVQSLEALLAGEFDHLVESNLVHEADGLLFYSDYAFEAKHLAKELRTGFLTS